jgi:integrase
MRIGWIDFDNENITVPATISKNHKEYTLPVPRNKLLDQLIQYKEYAKDLHLFTLTDVPGDKCCSKNYWATRFNTHRDTLQLSKEYTLYSLKHTGAILLHNAGATTKVIQMHMRHHSLDETDKYLRQMMAVESTNVRNSGINF